MTGMYLIFSINLKKWALPLLLTLVLGKTKLLWPRICLVRLLLQTQFHRIAECTDNKWADTFALRKADCYGILARCHGNCDGNSNGNFTGNSHWKSKWLNFSQNTCRLMWQICVGCYSNNLLKSELETRFWLVLLSYKSTTRPSLLIKIHFKSSKCKFLMGIPMGIPIEKVNGS